MKAFELYISGRAQADGNGTSLHDQEWRDRSLKTIAEETQLSQECAAEPVLVKN
jgi:hypothetical protein